MNYFKILGNGGVAFFTTLAATFVVGTGNLDAALIAAFIQGGLAFFLEVQEEAEKDTGDYNFLLI